MAKQKAAIIRYYAHGLYSEFYKTTIGVDFASKDLTINNKHVGLAILDIAGQERYGNYTQVYMSDASGAVIIFDANSPSELDDVNKWGEYIKRKVLTSEYISIPILLIGCLVNNTNESYKDLEEKYRKYSEEKGYIGYFIVDVKTGLNIEESFFSLAKYIVDNDIYPSSEEIDLTPKEGKGKKGEKNKVCVIQ
ncbi:Ras family protein [Histomonas meleagridis]|uniref:Ras family protein n=1 Tax=Histomonas meleagridis TaxID=135588 RepID=UPI003559B8D6|nr:Ras family protein [Histomonas meleagridis]KAH0803445.1 Ras family protein [Histomonas meleagridis]